MFFHCSKYRWMFSRPKMVGCYPRNEHFSRKWMVGIRSFPFGTAYFQGRTVSFMECRLGWWFLLLIFGEWLPNYHGMYQASFGKHVWNLCQVSSWRISVTCSYFLLENTQRLDWFWYSAPISLKQSRPSLRDCCVSFYDEPTVGWCTILGPLYEKDSYWEYL